MIRQTLQLALIKFWLKHRRLTGFTLWFCRHIYVIGPSGKIQIAFSNYRDFKTFREVFFEEQYKLPIDRPEAIKTIVDLGANMGYASAYFFLKYPNAQIIAVEPGQKTFEQLQHMSTENERIVAKQVALSDRNGSVALSFDPDASASASLVVRNENNKTFEVKSVTLSTLLEGLEEIDILKIDIEGSEEYVLQDPAIRKAKYIIAEIHPDLISVAPEELYKELPDFDYSLQEIGSSRFLLTAKRSY